jgi:hypothetical protein
MGVSRCYICDKNPAEAKQFGVTGFEAGQVCPICQRPTCRHHLVMVRWRWRTPQRNHDSALICRDCKKSYLHRAWDPVNREWIT